MCTHGRMGRYYYRVVFCQTEGKVMQKHCLNAVCVCMSLQLVFSLYCLLMARWAWNDWLTNRVDLGACPEESIPGSQDLISANVLVHYNPQQEVIRYLSTWSGSSVLPSIWGWIWTVPHWILLHGLCLLQRRGTPSWTKKAWPFIAYEVKKFHHYLFRRKFQIHSDHKPLQHLFSENASFHNLPQRTFRGGHWP